MRAEREQALHWLGVLSTESLREVPAGAWLTGQLPEELGTTVREGLGV